MANVEGKVTAITVLTPLRPGATVRLAVVFWAGRHLAFTLKKLHALSFIHYARWAVIRRFPDMQGGEKPHCSYLFFESNFNGTWDQYIDAFAEVVPARMTAIWNTSWGFPGPRPVEPFKDYIRRNEYAVNHYWSAYPSATTTQIVSAGRVADALAQFRRRTETLDPEQFQSEYESLLTSVQRDL